MKLNEAVNIIQGKVADKTAKKAEARYPNLGTIVTLEIDEKYYDIVENFAKDHFIENVPLPEHMAVPLVISDKYETVEIDIGTTYLMDGLVLDIVEGYEDGTNMLIAYGVSPPITKMIWKLAEDHDSLVEEAESPYFIVSSDIGELDLDIEHLTLKFNEYVGGMVSFTNIEMTHANHDSIVQMLDGWHPYED